VINIPETFRTAWVVDTEFIPDGPTCHPVCLVGHELRSGRVIRLWRDELDKSPPYSIGPDSLFIAYNAQAELGFHLAMDWPMPERILDLYFEFRHRTSGIWKPSAPRKLINALRFFDLNELDGDEKQDMINRILRGEAERVETLTYCERDAMAERRLFCAMAPEINWPYAIYRGSICSSLGTHVHFWHLVGCSFVSSISRQLGSYPRQTNCGDRSPIWGVRGSHV